MVACPRTMWYIMEVSTWLMMKAHTTRITPFRMSHTWAGSRKYRDLQHTGDVAHLGRLQEIPGSTTYRGCHTPGPVPGNTGIYNIQGMSHTWAGSRKYCDLQHTGDKLRCHTQYRDLQYTRDVTHLGWLQEIMRSITDCTRTYNRMYGDLQQNVLGPKKECTGTYNKMYHNLQPNVLGPTAECTGTYWDQQQNVLGPTTDCTRTYNRMYRDESQ